MAILLIGRFYTSVELAEYSLFMFFFNLVMVIFLWGDTVDVVDRYNDTAGVGGVSIQLGCKILDGLI